MAASPLTRLRRVADRLATLEVHRQSFTDARDALIRDILDGDDPPSYRAIGEAAGISHVMVKKIADR